MTRTGRLVIAAVLGAGAVAAAIWLLAGEGLDRAEKWVSITVGIASLGVGSAAFQLARRTMPPPPAPATPPVRSPASTDSPMQSAAPTDPSAHSHAHVDPTAHSHAHVDPTAHSHAPADPTAHSHAPADLTASAGRAISADLSDEPTSEKAASRPQPRQTPASKQSTPPAAPKYQVDISGAKGVIVGDHARQDITFTDPR